MTHIEQMIKDLCPNGVEWKTFAELGTFYGGLSGKSKDDFKDGNAKFVTYLNIGNNPALCLDIEETVKIGPNEKQNIVQYGDALFTGSSETPDECAMSSVVTEHPTEKLYLNSFCFGFRFNSLDGIIPSFYKHYFRCNAFRQAVRRTANGTTRFNVSKKEFAKLEIPIPPLEIQKKIVECLDKFSALAAELQAELQARRKQYEYYRTHLLTPTSESNSANNPDDRNWKWTTLGEIGTFTRGRRFVRTDLVEDGQPCFHYGDMYTYYGLTTNHTRTHLPKDFPVKLRYAEKGDIIIVGAGENDMDIGVGCVWEGDEPAAVHDACYIFKHKQNPRYISHFLRTLDYHLQIKKNVSTAKICAISPEGIAKAKIALPPLAEQNRIADLLDKFEALTTNLSEGIPAEQERQQKRYEYYRDKLLTFPKP